MAAYVSPEVELSQVGNPFGGAAVVASQSTLYHVAATDADHGKVSLTQFELTEDLESKKLAENPSNWATSVMSLPDVRYQNKSQGTTPTTFAQCAAVETTSGPIVFWTELPSSSPASAWGEVCATAFDADGQGWSSSVTLTWSDGTTVLGTPTTTAAGKKRGTDVSAVRFGSGSSDGDWIVLATLMRDNDGIVRLLLATYNVGDIDTDSDGKGNNRWPARSLVQLDVAASAARQATSLHVPITGLGNKVSIDWYQADPGGTITTMPNVQVAERPTFYLAVMVEALVATEGSSFLFLHLPIGCDPDTGAPILPDSVPPVSQGWYLPAAVPQVVRDPAGRLCVHVARPGTGSSTGTGITVSTYGTASAPAALPGATADTYWGQGNQLTALASEDLTATVAWNGVVSTYFMNGAAPLNPPVVLADDTASEYPVYQFLFYGSPLRVITRRYGTAQVALGPSYGLKPHDDNPSVISLRAIMDSPFPVPAINVPDGYSTYFGSLQYNSMDADSVTHQASFDLVVGVKASEKVTKGAGPAAEASLMAGPGAAMGRTHGEQSITAISFDSNPRPLPLGGGVDPNGGAAGGLAAGYDVWLVRFYDNENRAVVDSGSTDGHDAPDTLLIQQSLNLTSTNRTFAPFTCTPGDLSTYTPDALNARMVSLGWNWVNPTYGDVNYFRDAIDALAYVFRTPTGADRGNYMSFSWTPSLQSKVIPVVMDQDVSENSFTLDATAYAGVSGGEEGSIFGFGEGVAFEYLVGLEFTFKFSTSKSSSSQWGFTLDNADGIWGPPPSDVPGAIVRYDFRSYFLPPPDPDSPLATAHADYPIRSRAYWSAELARYLPAAAPHGATLAGSAIDRSSGAWRVVNVVTGYQTNIDTAVPYSWNDPSHSWPRPVMPG